MNKKLLFVCILLVAIIYVRYNSTYQKNYEIVQVYPSQLTPSILLEKNPVIVMGRPDMPVDEVISAFRYMYVSRTNQTETTGGLVNNARYCLITGTTDIGIINPKYGASENYQSVDVKLKPGHVLILPMYWRFDAGQDTVKYTQLHDVFSYVYKSISR